MKKVRSLIAALILCSMVLCSFANAANIPNIVYLPASTDDNYPIASSTDTFDLDTRTGLVLYEASVKGTGKVTKSSVTGVIQRYENGNWVNVSGTSVTATSNSDYASFDKRIYVLKGYQYRMEVTLSVYVGSTRYVEVIHTDSTPYF